MHMTKSSIARVCGAAAALFLFGCGSSSISGDPAAAFAGSWTFGSGSIRTDVQRSPVSRRST